MNEPLGVFLVPSGPSRFLLALPTDGRITSLFGRRLDPVSRSERFHRGLDIAARPGMLVAAAAPGEVVRCGRVGGYGLMVEIDHGYGAITRYAHLVRTLVQVGDPVERGAIIGLMGATGRATASHLHFEVLLGGTPVDPLEMLVQ